MAAFAVVVDETVMALMVLMVLRTREAGLLQAM
jgi:hypothetical protein